MGDKVSIIVPVYGVEKYIGECIESLVKQTHRNLEIILVDDGGMDRSAEICEEYAALDNRIRVIHKPNGGAASARNVGIDVATGEYICFVDGDDYVEKSYVEHLLMWLTEADTDISECGLHFLTKSQTKPVKIDGPGCFNKNDYLLRFITRWTCSLMTNKLFKRSVIGSIRFEEGHCIDDEFFTYLVVMNGQKVVVKDTPLYYYRMRGSSVMQDVGPHQERIMLDRIEYMTTRYRNIAERVPQLEPAFFQDVLDTMIRYWVHSKDMPTAQKQIRQWIRAHTGRFLRMKEPLRQRLIHLYQLYVMKPTVTAEPNPLQTDSDELFD